MGFLCRGCHSKAQTGICPICLLRDMLQLRNQIRGLKNDSETVQAKMDDLLREKVSMGSKSCFCKHKELRCLPFLISFFGVYEFQFLPHTNYCHVDCFGCTK